MKDYTKIGISVIVACALALGVAATVYARCLDLDRQPAANPATTPADLEMLKVRRPATRGRILAVVTSTAKAGSGINAGFELTELSRAYYAFLANGFEVDIASPMGGRPPMNIDDDLTDVDFAFINDPVARRLVDRTLKLREVDASRYTGIYLVGGKGTMFDFPGNDHLAELVATVYGTGGVVGAVCHGPAGLIDVQLANGRPLLAGKRVTGFSNAEELFLISNARSIFPFLLEDALANSAAYESGPMYLDHTIIDGRLVTGQNPWSTWSVAEGMVRAMGFVPVPRKASLEENGIRVIAAYHRGGLAAAKEVRDELGHVDKRLLLMHALIEGRTGRLRGARDLLALTHF